MHDAYILFEIFNKNTAAEVSIIKLILNVKFQKFCATDAPENVTLGARVEWYY